MEQRLGQVEVSPVHDTQQRQWLRGICSSRLLHKAWSCTPRNSPCAAAMYVQQCLIGCKSLHVLHASRYTATPTTHNHVLSF
jgi:hypothetical protein